MNTISQLQSFTKQHDGPFQAGQIFKLLDDNSIVILAVSTKNQNAVLINLVTGQPRRLPVAVRNVLSITFDEVHKMTGMTAFVVDGSFSLYCPEPIVPVRSTKVAGVPVSTRKGGNIQINGYTFTRKELNELVAFVNEE